MINFSDCDSIDNLIELERVFVLSTLDIQKNLNKQILIFMKTFISNIKISSDISPYKDVSIFLNEANSNLNKSDSNITSLNKLLNLLEKTQNYEINSNDFIKDYNEKFKETMNLVRSNTETIEKFIYQFSTTELSEKQVQSATNETTISDTVITENMKTEETANQSTSLDLIENTLIISESNKKVVLPYNISTIKDILQSNTKRYKCIEDVIEKLYTKPISCYRFSSIARFQEAFKLVKEREKGSTIKAFSLAFELLGNYNLHPAIISACNSLDELDIYLACLDDNTLEDFHFFDIKFEIPLALSKFQTISTLISSKLAKNKA